MHNSQRCRVGVFLSIAVIFTGISIDAGVASAATYTWNTTGGTAWSIASDWSGSVPGASDVGVFGGASYASQPTLGSTASVGGLWVTGAGALTLSGTTLYISGTSFNGNANYGVELDSNAGAVTISAPLVLTGSQTWSNNSINLLTISGGVSEGTNSLTISGSGNTTVSAAISGTGSLTKTGLGLLTMNTVSTFSGPTTVSGGTLQLNNANGASGALGSSSVLVNSGATLLLNAGDVIGYTTGRNPLTINDGLVSNITSASRVTLYNAVTMTGGTLTGTGVGDASGCFSFDGATALVATSDAAGNPALINAASISLQAGTDTFNVTRGAASPASDLTIASNIINYSGVTGSLIQTGNGIMTITSSTSYTGSTTISGGTMILAGTASLGGGAYAGAIASNASLQFNTTSNQILSGILSGSGSIIQNGATLLTLSNAANTFSGSTIINSGSVLLTAGGAAQYSTINLNVSNSGLLFATGVGTFGLGGLSGAGNLALADTAGGALSLIVGNNGANNVYTGVLSGAGSLTKTGTGTETLRTTATYNGSTSLYGGTLLLDFTGPGATSSNMLASGGSITFAGGNLSLKGSSGVANSQTLSNPSFVAGASGITFVPNGSTGETLTLGNAWTRIAQSTLNITLPTGSTLASNPTLTGPAVGILPYATVNNTDFATVAGGQVVALPSYNVNTYSSTANSDITALNPSPGAFTVNSLRLNAPQSNTLTLTGSNTISSGALLVGSGVGANSTSITGGSLSGSAGGELIVHNWDPNGQLQINSTISNDGGPTSLTITGNGNTILGSANSFSGVTKVLAGTLSLGSALALQNSTLDTSGSGTVNFGGFTSYTVPAIQGAGGTFALSNSAGQAVTLNFGTNNANTTDSTSFTGAGSLVKVGNGTVTLAGASTFAGGTTVSAGIVKLGSGVGIGNTASNVTVNSGATIDANGQSLNLVSQTFVLNGTGAAGEGGALVNSVPASGTAAGAWIRNITLAGNTTISTSGELTIGSSSSSAIPLNLAGYTLTKTGSGILALNGVSLSSAGNIVINQGTLQIPADYNNNVGQQSTSLTGTGSIIVNPGTALNLTHWSGTLTMSMPITLNGGSFTSSYPGPNGVTIASPITLTANSVIKFNGGGGTTQGNATLSGNITGPYNLALGDSYGTLTLGGNNTYSGITTITNGNVGVILGSTNALYGSTLNYNNSGGYISFGSLSSAILGGLSGAQSLPVQSSNSAFTLATGANGQTTVYSGVLSGTGNFAKTGSGLFSLTGSNTYTGSTSVSAGTMTVDFSAAGAPVNNIINFSTNSSSLSLGSGSSGGVFIVKANTGVANSQQFNGLSLAGGGSVFQLNGNGGGEALASFSSITTTTSGSALLIDASLANGGAVTVSNSADSTGIYGTGRIVYYDGTSYNWPTTTSTSSPYTMSGYAGYTALPASGAASTVNYSVGSGTTNITSETVNTLKVVSSGLSPNLAIASGNELTVNSGGILMTGAATYTISGGSITASNGSGGYDVIFQQYGSANMTVSSLIANNGSTKVGLTKAGPGYLTITGANTFTGINYVDGGTLEVQTNPNAGNTGPLYTVAVGATLRLGYSNNQYYGTPITVYGSGLNSTAGVYFLAGKLFDFGGLFDIKTAPTTIGSYGSGTASLNFGYDGTNLYCEAPASGTVFSSSVSFALDRIALTNGGAIQVDAGANTATGDLTINGLITGGNFAYSVYPAITKNGTGSLKLTNANSFVYGGQSYVYIANGSIILSGGNNRLPAASTILSIGSGATNGQLILGDSTGPVSQTVLSIVNGGTGGGNAVVGGNASVSTLVVSDTAADTYTGLLGGSGSNQNNLALTVSASSTLTLTNTASTYGGGTNLALGVLSFAASTLGSSTVAFTGPGTLQWNGANIQDVSTSNGLKINDGVTGTLDTNGNTITLGSAIQTGPLDTGSLTKVGSGTLILAASNTYGGGTTISVGTLQAGNYSAVGTGVVTIPGGSLLDVHGFNLGVSSLAGTGVVDNLLGSGTLSLGVNNVTSTFSGIIQNSVGTLGLAKTGAGAVTLTSNNTYSGPTTINAGSLIVMGSPTGTAPYNVNAGGTLSGLGLVSGPVNVAANGAVLPGVLSTGAAGTGILTLASLNLANSADTVFNLSGTTTSGDSLIAVSGALSLTGTTLVTVDLLSPALASNSSYPLFTFGSLSGTPSTEFTLAPGAVTSRQSATFSTSGNTVYLNVIGSVQNLVWSGTNGGPWNNNTLNKAWINSQGNADIFVTADNVSFTNSSNVTSVQISDIVSPSSVAITGSNSYSFSGNGSIAGLTSVVINSTGVITLGTSNSYSGGTIVQSGSLVQSLAGGFPANGALTIGSSGNSVVVNLGGINTQLGNLTTGAGAIAANQVIGSSSTTNSATLTVNATGLDVFGGMVQNTVGSGNQTLALSVGSGTLELTGPNTYTGPTMIAAGAGLQIGAGSLGAAIATSSIADSGSLTFNQGESATSYSGPISGIGSLTMAGTGALSLSNTSTYSGATTVTSGTLDFGSTGGIPNTSSLSIASSSQLNIGISNGIGFSGSQGWSVAGTLNITNSASLTMPAVLAMSNGTITSPAASGNTLGNLYESSNGTIAAIGPGNTISTANLAITSGTVMTVKTPAATDALVISAAIIGSTTNATGGLTKSGLGTLTLTGVGSNYMGTTTVAGGVLTYSGSASYNGRTGASGDGSLSVGTAAGNGVVNINTSGALSFGYNFNVGAANNASGAVYQNSGTVVARDTTYGGLANLGNGTGSYGYYGLAGGNFNLSSGGQGPGFNWTGLRIGYTGIGNFLQSGGIMTVDSNMIIGSNAGSSGVATYTGGAATSATAYDYIDGQSGTGVLNIGTESGGTAVFTSQSNGTGSTTIPAGLIVGGASGGTGTLNINSGTLNITSGSINKVAGATGVVNFNGGTLQSTAAGLTLIDNSLTSVNIFNGGAIVDMEGATGTISANLLATTGSGIYPSGGSLAISSSGGSGYIGAPLVKVTGGSGSGAMAIADMSGGVITGVTLTSPGQNYQAGNVLTFSFTGGGATTGALAYTYTLSAADVAANYGGLTKTGPGTLLLTGSNTYNGGTHVVNGTLQVGSNNALGTGALTVNSGVLDLYGNNPTVASLSGSGGLITNGYVPGSVLSINSSSNSTFGGSFQDGYSSVGLNLMGGTLTLTGVTNVNTGPTNIAGGTLIAGGTNVFSSNSPFNLNSGVLDVTAGPQSIGSLTVNGGSLNLNASNLLTTVGYSTLSGGSLHIFGATVPTELISFNGGYSGTFANVVGLPTGDALYYNYSGNQLDLISSVASWNNASNWSTGTVPSGQGVLAVLGTTPTTGPATQWNVGAGSVSLDSAQTLGALVFNNSAGFTLIPGASGSLTMDNTGGAGNASIVVLSGTHSILAPLILAGSNTAVSVLNAGSGLTIGGNISDSTAGNSTLTFSSSDGSNGTLILSGTNSFGANSGGLVDQSGTVILEGAASLATGAGLTIGVASPGAVFSAPPAPLASAAALAPVPEPGTVALLTVAGLVGLGIWRRKRQA